VKKWFRGKELLEMGIPVFEINEGIWNEALTPINPQTGEHWGEVAAPRYLNADDGFIGKRHASKKPLEDALFISTEVENFILKFKAESTAISLSSVNTSEDQDTPEVLLEALNAAGEHDPEKLAAEIKKQFSKLSPRKIGKLLPAEPGKKISPSGERSRGLRLLGRKK
jgi:hypothetical protein